MLSSNSNPIRQLVPEEMPIVAHALGESPETVVAWYMLWNGACNAWCAGDMHDPRAVVIQAHLIPAAPIVFGTSAVDIVEILRQVEGWTSVLVPTSLARELERPIAELADTLSISTRDDIFFVLEDEIATVPIPDNVRLLTPADEELLGGPGAFAADAFGETIIAAAIEDGEIVSLVHSFAWSADYVDIGAMTHEAARAKGYATAAAALVAREILARRKVPVWSCGAYNEGALRVAAKLGFREHSRRIYITPQRSEDTAPGT